MGASTISRLALAAGAALFVAAAPGPADPATAAARCPRIIRNADGGRTIALARHACATLRLGGALQWSTPRSSSRRVEVTNGPTRQSWYLTAAHTGTARITSVGRPRCAAGQACPAFIVAFGVRIRVVARTH